MLLHQRVTSASKVSFLPARRVTYVVPGAPSGLLWECKDRRCYAAGAALRLYVLCRNLQGHSIDDATT